MTLFLHAQTLQSPGNLKQAYSVQTAMQPGAATHRWLGAKPSTDLATAPKAALNAAASLLGLLGGSFLLLLPPALAAALL
jgi:hypothetical protein